MFLHNERLADPAARGATAAFDGDPRSNRCGDLPRWFPPDLIIAHELHNNLYVDREPHPVLVEMRTEPQEPRNRQRDRPGAPLRDSSDRSSMVLFCTDARIILLFFKILSYK